MRKGSISTLLIVTSLTPILIGCNSTGLSPLKSELAKYNYTLYEPPQSDRGPGWTFQLVKTYNGQVVPITVCQNIYSNIPPAQSDLSLPNVTSTSTVGLDFAIDFLSGLISSAPNAKANLKDISNIEITWGNVSAKEIPKEHQFDEVGQVRKIHPACYKALQDLKKSNALVDQVFVVQSAAMVDTFKYKFSRNSESALSGGASLPSRFGIKAGVNYKVEGNTALEISEPRYIGFVAIAILDWLPTGLLTAESAKIKGRIMKHDEFAKLLQ
jgi:hypothetical protein